MDMNDELAALLRHARIERLHADYCASLDEDRLEDWPQLFTADGVYRMVSRENHAQGYPIPLLFLDGRDMMIDRIQSLRTANIYQPHRYRHATSGLRILATHADHIETSASFIVVQTLQEGFCELYQAGSYYDELVETAEGLRFRQRLVVYDSARVKTLLATPV